MGMTLAERLAARKQQETDNGTDTARLDTQTTQTEAPERQQATQVEQTVVNDEKTTNITPTNAQSNPPVSLVSAELLDAVRKEQTVEDILDTKLYDRGILSQGNITVEDIVPRIEQLNNLSEMDAEQEMKLLKAALMANPAAVSLMLPEHVGTLVSTLRRITKEAIVSNEKAKKTPKASTKVTANMELAEDF
jgi:hypothetical protein